MRINPIPEIIDMCCINYFMIVYIYIYTKIFFNLFVS